MALKHVYAEESGHEWDPLFIIFDGSIAIATFVKMAFPGCPMKVCWEHITRNVDKKLLGVRSEERRKRFSRDFHLLYLVTSRRKFRDILSLFKAHYNPNRELVAMVPYIQEIWIDLGLENWF